MDEEVDTGFAAVIANPDAVWKPPAEEGAPVTATVNPGPENNDIIPIRHDTSLDTGGIDPKAKFVTEPEPSKGLTPEGIQAAKSLVQLPKELTVHILARLAREIAQNIRETHVILADYKINQTQFDWLCAYHEFFKQALHHSVIEWNAAGNTQERIKLQAAAGFEDKLPLLLTRMGNTTEGLPGVVEAAKLVAKVAGVGERDVGAGAPGEKFSITINLGADEKVIVGSKDVTPSDQTKARSGSLATNTEGNGAGQTISANTEADGTGSSFRLITEGTREGT